jgi:hypothetical protein
MKDEMNATLVDSFALGQSPLPRGFTVYPAASQHAVFSPAVADLLLVRP